MWGFCWSMRLRWPGDWKREMALTLKTEVAGLEPKPAGVRWTLPSIADVLFLVIIGTLLLRPEGTGLLGDADTGWHIRNGEQILATHVVPLTDSFSYTRGGQPWFAWEWLFDVLVAGIHHVAGLNGVSLLAVLMVAGMFALMFGLLRRRGGNLLVAVVLTMLAAAASQVHLLARPHIFTWLFTLLFVEVLFRFREGGGRVIWWLPALMLLWVNLHGGFLLGLVLIAMFAGESAWIALRGDKDWQELGTLVGVGAATGLATFVTPYGYQLHVHVYRYLSSSYLMNRIQEFASPSFHEAGSGYFETFLVLAVVCCAVGWRRVRVIDVLLLLFGLHAGLYASRNIPIAGILMAYALAGPLTELLAVAGTDVAPRVVRKGADGLRALAVELEVLEGQLRGHLLAGAVAVLLVAAALHGGRIGGWQALNEEFAPTKFPVGAVNYLQAHGVRGQVFSTDSWSGYLIYRMWPDFRVFMDDRHDFYGDEFVKRYVETLGGGADWKGLPDQYGANRVLVPPGLAYTSLLRATPEWHEEYKDDVSVLFCRADGCPVGK